MASKKGGATATAGKSTRSKAELAAELVKAMPSALKGPEDTPERLAKRCTVAELERMLDEAREARAKEQKEHRTIPDPTWQGDPGRSMPIGDTLPAQPEWLKVGARVHVAEAPGEDPAFYGTIVEGVQEGQVCVRPEDTTEATMWVEVEDVTQDTREADYQATVLHGPLADAPADQTLPPGATLEQLTQDAGGTDALLALVQAEGINWEDMATDEARAAEEKALAAKARVEARATKPAKASTTAKEHKAELPPVGTVLKHGTQEAKVVPGGVEFDGVVYASLSGAAKVASVKAGLGDKVSGWVYWGLKKKESTSGKAPKATRGPDNVQALVRAARWLVRCGHSQGEDQGDGTLAGGAFYEGAKAMLLAVFGDAVEEEQEALAMIAREESALLAEQEQTPQA